LEYKDHSQIVWLDSIAVSALSRNYQKNSKEFKLQNRNKTNDSNDGSCPDNMFALKVSQQRLLAKWKQLIYRVLC